MVRALAGLILLLAAPPAFAQPGDWGDDSPRHGGDGARILLLNDYRLPAGETAHGPVIVLGGTATIDGHADDDVVVLGGRVRVGPEAVVDGEVVTVGGEADVDPHARVQGGVDATVVRFPDIDGNWGSLPRGWFTGVALVATVFRLLLVLVVASMLTLVAPGFVRRIAWRASEGVASSAAIGFVCEVAFIPVLVVVVVALAISIVGIPLIAAMPFVIGAAGLAGTAGFTAVAARVGARVRGTTVEESRALFIDMVIGFALISAMTVFARFAAFGVLWDNPVTWSVSAAGLLIEYVVWTIGIGAACASLLANWKGRRITSTTPPAPATI
jgi:hypothetical protein